MDVRAEVRVPGQIKKTGLPSCRLHAGIGGLLGSLHSLSTFNYLTLQQAEQLEGKESRAVSFGVSLQLSESPCL